MQNVWFGSAQSVHSLQDAQRKRKKKKKKMNINQTMRTFIRCKLNAYGLYHLICFERPRSRLNEIDTVGFEL